MRVHKVEELIEQHYRSIQLSPEKITEIRLALGEALASQRQEAEAEKHVQTLRIARLSREREQLLQLHYAEALPIDLFRQDQNRITAALENARTQLAAVSVAFDVIEQNVKRALELAEDCHAAYVSATPTIRRLFNQAFFVKLILANDGQVTHEYAEPFKVLLDPRLPKQLRSETRRRKSSKGSNNENDLAQSKVESSSNTVLVGPAGLEPATGRL